MTKQSFLSNCEKELIKEINIDFRVDDTRCPFFSSIGVSNNAND